VSKISEGDGGLKERASKEFFKKRKIHQIMQKLLRHYHPQRKPPTKNSH
jgi:hypothetical protein